MSDVTMRKCDLTGRVGEPNEIERVGFGLDGAEFEIDLDPEYAGNLRYLFRQYVSAARRTGGGPTRTRQRQSNGEVSAPAPASVGRSAVAAKMPGTDERKRKIAEMRTWASKIGYVVGASARFPHEVEEHYDEVGGKTAGVEARGKYAATAGMSVRELAKAGTE